MFLLCWLDLSFLKHYGFKILLSICESLKQWLFPKEVLRPTAYLYYCCAEFSKNSFVVKQKGFLPFLQVYFLSLEENQVDVLVCWLDRILNPYCFSKSLVS